VRELVIPIAPAERIGIAVSPYYGWVIERLVEAIKPDAWAGEAQELPAIEANRPSRTRASCGSKRGRAAHVATVCAWRPSARAGCAIVRPWRSWLSWILQNVCNRSRPAPPSGTRAHLPLTNRRWIAKSDGLTRPH
jgi:hypothetical protein